MKIEKGIAESSSILKDLKGAYESGVYNDIRFKCSDGIEVASIKSFLSIRVPFFAKMFYGSLQNTIQDEVDFNSCDSQTLKYILDYVWKGGLEMMPLSINTLLNILETSRMLCLDTLMNGVENHVIHRIEQSINVDICEWLEALDFAVSYKFDVLFKSLLLHLDRYLDDAVKVPRFHSLSTDSITAFLASDFRHSKGDSVFEAFLIWIKNNEVDASTRCKILEGFYCNLNKLSSLYICQTVQETGYYEHEVIFSVLAGKIVNENSEKDKVLSQKDEEIQQLNYKLENCYCD